MQYIRQYISPLGRMLMAADNVGLSGLWFEGQRHFGQGLAEIYEEGESPVFREACRWLDLYFSGQMPDFPVPLHPAGTDFQREVWSALLEIPYGQTATYGQVAAAVSAGRCGTSVLARAVGQAVGRNPLALIVPCHRVLGAGGRLTGYAGGLDRKRELLELEAGVMKALGRSGRLGRPMKTAGGGQ